MFVPPTISDRQHNRQQLRYAAIALFIAFLLHLFFSVPLIIEAVKKQMQSSTVSPQKKAQVVTVAELPKKIAPPKQTPPIIPAQPVPAQPPTPIAHKPLPAPALPQPAPMPQKIAVGHRQNIKAKPLTQDVEQIGTNDTHYLNDKPLIAETSVAEPVSKEEPAPLEEATKMMPNAESKGIAQSDPDNRPVPVDITLEPTSPEPKLPVDTGLIKRLDPQKKNTPASKNAPGNKSERNEAHAGNLLQHFAPQKFYETAARIQGDVDYDRDQSTGDPRFASYLNRVHRLCQELLTDGLVAGIDRLRRNSGCLRDASGRPLYDTYHIPERYVPGFVQFIKEKRSIEVVMTIERTGKTANIKVIRSSGIPEVDHYFITGLQQMGNELPPFPAWIDLPHIILSFGFSGDIESGEGSRSFREFYL